VTPEIYNIQNRLYGIRGYLITGAVCLVVGITLAWPLAGSFTNPPR
jgi:hypothetical protein